MTGTLYGLGLGPGDPELITLKSWRILSMVPVVAWPVGPSGHSRARAVAEPFLPEDVLTLALPIPFGAAAEKVNAAYDAAARQIAAHLTAGRDVAYLCLGDPLFHGTFIHLSARLAIAHAVRAVPGVMAPSAAAAVLGAPLAHGRQPLKILPATLDDAAIRAELTTTPNAALAFIKAGRHLARLRALIEEAGLLDVAHVVADIGLPQQRHIPLAALERARDTYFSVVLVLPAERP